MSVLIDIDTLIDGEHPNSVLDCGLPIDLPVETLRRWACQADITPIITAADGISLYLPDAPNESPTAPDAAPCRAMYRHCAIPGCTTAYDHCQIHHIHWYRNRENANIDNLAPLCNKHHLVHEGGWHLTLNKNRNLTTTYPNGTTENHPAASLGRMTVHPSIHPVRAGMRHRHERHRPR